MRGVHNYSEEPVILEYWKMCIIHVLRLADRMFCMDDLMEVSPHGCDAEKQL